MATEEVRTARKGKEVADWRTWFDSALGDGETKVKVTRRASENENEEIITGLVKSLNELSSDRGGLPNQVRGARTEERSAGNSAI